MNRLTIILLLVSGLFMISETSFAQGSISNLSVEDEYEKYRDSLKTTPYEWRLPIMGAKLRKLGFDLPNPNGFMITYANSAQDLTVSNLFVGFSPDKLIGVDGIARFNQIQANVNAVTARYDFWLLPFINLYAIGGYITSETKVGLGLPFEMDFTAHSEGPTLGWGAVVAGGIGSFVMSADYTNAYTWTGSTSEATTANVFGARVGHMFRFKKKPNKNLVVLVGGQYLGINKSSGGDVDLDNLLGITNEDKLKASEQLDAWYDELPNKGQEIVEPLYNGLSSWLNNGKTTNLYYTFDKALHYPWSASVGFNYQHNRRYQLTCMYSFLGSREQVVIGLSYRFGWHGKNLLQGLTL